MLDAATFAQAVIREDPKTINYIIETLDDPRGPKHLDTVSELLRSQNHRKEAKELLERSAMLYNILLPTTLATRDKQEMIFVSPVFVPLSYLDAEENPYPLQKRPVHAYQIAFPWATTFGPLSPAFWLAPPFGYAPQVLPFMNRDSLRQHALHCFLKDVEPFPKDYRVGVPEKHRHHRFMLFYVFGTLDGFLGSNLLHVMFADNIHMFPPAQQMTIHEVRGKWSAEVEANLRLQSGPDIQSVVIGPMLPLRQIDRVRHWHA